MAGERRNEMNRSTRVAILALALAAILSSVLGGANDAAAANGYEQWVASTDGCVYYWDGVAYTAAACPRTDGNLYFYSLDQNGRWLHVATVGYASDGSLSIWYLGLEHDTLYPSSMTIGAPSYSFLTGNPVIDQVLIGYLSGTNSNTLKPECLYVAHNGNTCYYT
jgi:hypothetical protein